MRNDIWRKQAETDLKMYEASKLALVNIPDQIKELEEKITSIRSQTADSVSVRGGGSRDDAYLNNIVARDRLNANLEENRRFVSRVTNALSVLSDDEKELLDRFYVRQEKSACFNIADEKKVERKTVYRMKDIALAKFSCAMYGNN